MFAHGISVKKEKSLNKLCVETLKFVVPFLEKNCKKKQQIFSVCIEFE